MDYSLCEDTDFYLLMIVSKELRIIEVLKYVLNKRFD